MVINEMGEVIGIEVDGVKGILFEFKINLAQCGATDIWFQES